MTWCGALINLGEQWDFLGFGVSLAIETGVVNDRDREREA